MAKVRAGGKRGGRPRGSITINCPPQGGQVPRTFHANGTYRPSLPSPHYIRCTLTIGGTTMDGGESWSPVGRYWYAWFHNLPNAAVVTIRVELWELVGFNYELSASDQKTHITVVTGTPDCGPPP